MVVSGNADETGSPAVGRAALREWAVAVAADAVITVDEVGTITSWNPEAERMFGIPEGDAVGQSLAIIVPAQHRTRHIAGFRAAMQSGRLQHEGRPARIQGATAEGRLLQLEMTLALLPSRDGLPTGAVAVVRSGALDPDVFAIG